MSGRDLEQTSRLPFQIQAGLAGSWHSEPAIKRIEVQLSVRSAKDTHRRGAGVENSGKRKSWFARLPSVRRVIKRARERLSMGVSPLRPVALPTLSPPWSESRKGRFYVALSRFDAARSKVAEKQENT